MSGCADDCKGGSGLLDGLKDCIDSVLSVRDCVGAVLHPVEILTRTWSGERPGDGDATEETIEISPSPQIVDFSHDVRITEGGAVKQGDIIIRGISKNAYPNESEINCAGVAPNIEKYYLINEKIYTVINVKENYLTWDVQLRKRSDETRKGE